MRIETKDYMLLFFSKKKTNVLLASMRGLNTPIYRIKAYLASDKLAAQEPGTMLEKSICLRGF